MDTEPRLFRRVLFGQCPYDTIYLCLLAMGNACIFPEVQVRPPLSSETVQRLGLAAGAIA